MNFDYKEKNQASKESNFINTKILIDILKKSRITAAEPEFDGDFPVWSFPGSSLVPEL